MKKITIYDQDWEIRNATDKELVEVMQAEDKQRQFNGVCSQREQTIYLFEDLPYKSKKKTLIHELIHAFIFEVGPSFGRDDTEDVCDFYAFIHPELNRILKQVDKWLGGNK